MLRGVEVPVVFVQFTANLVSYGLKQVLDVDWQSPYKEPNGKAFDEIVGMAAVVFRHRHVDEFNDNITQCPIYIFEDCATTLEYVQEFIDNNFKGVAPIMEFIVYCAFILDLTVCCVTEDKKEYLQEIVEESYDLYEDHIKPYFQLIGGFQAIKQVAQQYLEFVTDMRLYGALVKGDNAAAGTANDSHVDDTILSIENQTDRANGSHLNGSSSASATCTSAGNDPCASADYNMEFGPNDKDSDVNDGARCDDSRVSVIVPKVAQGEYATASDSQVGASIFSDEYRMGHKATANGTRLNGSSHSNATCSSDGNVSNASADSNMEVDSNGKESYVNGSARANLIHFTGSANGNYSSASADSNMDVDPNDKELNVNNNCDDSRVSGSVIDVHSLRCETGDTNNTSVCDDSHAKVSVHDNASPVSSSGVPNKNASEVSDDSNMRVVESRR